MILWNAKAFLGGTSRSREKHFEQVLHVKRCDLLLGEQARDRLVPTPPRHQTLGQAILLFVDVTDWAIG